MYFLFDLFPILFTLAFCLIFGMMAVMLVRSVSTWNKNNHSPRLTVEALVSAKRMEVHSHHHQNGGVHSSTSYYMTFQVESGDRMELSVPGTEYGLLAEGDRGLLTFQGTRYISFQRI